MDKHVNTSKREDRCEEKFLSNNHLDNNTNDNYVNYVNYVSYDDDGW